jgi:ubiquinone/menaquinone biosynthesis C-methylase UbiE
MKQKINLKDLVKIKYGKIAEQSKLQNQNSCCGTNCNEVDYTIFSEDYKKINGYNPAADLGLGCGIPTEFANIKTGNTVLDLGSGAGNDCFVARTIVGEKGKVYGLDFTEKMLEKANHNLQKTGFKNIEFVKGDIENIPMQDNIIDVVISNCVLNLVPDKEKAFSEIHRVLKNGGHFCVSDVVLRGNLPEKLKKDAEMYAGCVSGAIDKDEYLNIIEKTGFLNISVKKEKEIILPDEILKNYLNESELLKYKSDKIGIFSITVYAEKL